MIVPDKTDLERAKTFGFKSSKQLAAQANAMKDANKALRRGIALLQVDEFAGYMNPFLRRAKELGATKEMVESFEATMIMIKQGYHARTKANNDMVRIKHAPIKAFLKDTFEAKMLKKSKGQLRSLGNYRKHVGGDTLEIKAFTYEFNQWNRNKVNDIKVWVDLTFIDGYFATNSSYGFYLIYKTDGSFCPSDWGGYKKVVTMGKKDTEKLNSLLETLKK
jgi:hypothetical protein